MAMNLLTNVRRALEGLILATKDHCWLDSSIALHWIADKGEYLQFVQNRVSRIQSHSNMLWHHVPSTDNPTDLGSHGGSIVGTELWCDGPAWLSEPAKWPDDIMPEPSPENMAGRSYWQNLNYEVQTVQGHEDLSLIHGTPPARSRDHWLQPRLRNLR